MYLVSAISKTTTSLTVMMMKVMIVIKKIKVAQTTPAKLQQKLSQTKMKRETKRRQGLPGDSGVIWMMKGCVIVMRSSMLPMSTVTQKRWLIMINQISKEPFKRKRKSKDYLMTPMLMSVSMILSLRLQKCMNLLKLAQRTVKRAL